MNGERGRRLRSFLIGGLVGSAAGIAAGAQMRMRRQPQRREAQTGLAAFEQAPCYRELMEREAAEDPPASFGSGSSRAPRSRSAG